MKAPISILLGFLLLTCCAPRETSKIVLGNSSTSVYESGSVNFAHYKTFAVFPFTRLSSTWIENRDDEIQSLFFLRNQMEAKGYTFVGPDKKPDFWISPILYSAATQKPVLPDTLPTVVISSSDLNAASWGSFQPLSKNNLDFTSSAAFVGAIPTSLATPQAMVVIYDGKTYQKQWYGIGKPDSDSENTHLLEQDAVASAIANFPERRQKPVESEPHGAIGVRLQIYSTNGESYLPMVLAFAKTSPAREAGMKEKDCILSVDGRTLTNMSFRESNDLIRGRPNSIVTLVVLREDQHLTFTIKRLPWSGVWGQWPGEN